MRRIGSVQRGASWSRGQMHVTQKAGPFVPLAETVREKGLALDVTDQQYESRNDGGETGCLDRLLREVAFDALGAARFLRDQNHGFARQSVASALDELTAVAMRLGVSR